MGCAWVWVGWTRTWGAFRTIMYIPTGLCLRCSMYFTWTILRNNSHAFSYGHNFSLEGPMLVCDHSLYGLEVSVEVNLMYEYHKYSRWSFFFLYVTDAFRPRYCRCIIGNMFDNLWLWHSTYLNKCEHCSTEPSHKMERINIIWIILEGTPY